MANQLRAGARADRRGRNLHWWPGTSKPFDMELFMSAGVLTGTHITRQHHVHQAKMIQTEIADAGSKKHRGVGTRSVRTGFSNIALAGGVKRHGTINLTDHGGPRKILGFQALSGDLVLTVWTNSDRLGTGIGSLETYKMHQKILEEEN